MSNTVEDKSIELMVKSMLSIGKNWTGGYGYRHLPVAGSRGSHMVTWVLIDESQLLSGL